MRGRSIRRFCQDRGPWRPYARLLNFGYHMSGCCLSLSYLSVYHLIPSHVSLYYIVILCCLALCGVLPYRSKRTIIDAQEQVLTARGRRAVSPSTKPEEADWSEHGRLGFRA